MSSSQGELRFPLEERFMARVRINSNRFEDWKTIAQREIDGVLMDPKSWYYRPNDLKMAYRPVYEQDAIRGFVKPVDNSVKKDLLGLAHLQMTLEDVVFGLHTISTSDQRAAFAQLYGENFLDGAVLRVVEGATANDPFHFVGLKWLAFASPAQAILTNRDYVYFEYSGTTQDAAGRKVLFLFQRSFPLHGEELAEPEKGCTRGVFNQLLLFRIESGAVLMQGIGQFDPAGDVPTWVATRAITETFDSIKNIVGLPDARAISSTGLIKQPSAPKSSGDNKVCVGCNKKFGMMRSRHGCRSCGQSMCKHCVTTLSFFNDEAFFSAVPTVVTESFCTGCLKNARDRRQIETLSATLTKTNISLATTTTMSTTTGGYRTDAISTELSSPYDSTNARPPSHREGLRHSIERQIGIHHSDSESSGSAAGSSRSHSKYGPVLGDDTGLTHSPASSASFASTTNLRQKANAPVMFEAMNESIRQQEELLMVIQQERAKMQARQQYPPAPGIAPTHYVPPPYEPVSTSAVQAPVSPVSHDGGDDDRFQYENQIQGVDSTVESLH